MIKGLSPRSRSRKCGESFCDAHSSQRIQVGHAPLCQLFHPHARVLSASPALSVYLTAQVLRTLRSRHTVRCSSVARFRSVRADSETWLARSGACMRDLLRCPLYSVRGMRCLRAKRLFVLLHMKC